MYGSDRYYANVALDAMGKAYGHCRDEEVAAHISRAIAALQELSHLGACAKEGDDRRDNDPHEMSEFNSAI